MLENPIAQRIQALLDERGESRADLCRKTGIKYHSINPLWVRPAAKISAENAAAVAKYLGVSVPYILRGEADKSETTTGSEEADLIPIYNVEAAAGHGALVEGEDVVDLLALPPGYIRKLTSANPRNLTIISVKGDSMNPTLKDDDIVMLDMTKRDLSYDGIFVFRDLGTSDGNGLQVKRIGRGTRRGYVMLISDNNRLWPPVERAADEIEVVGRVIWTGSKV